MHISSGISSGPNMHTNMGCVFNLQVNLMLGQHIQVKANMQVTLQIIVLFEKVVN